MVSKLSLGNILNLHILSKVLPKNIAIVIFVNFDVFSAKIWVKCYRNSILRTDLDFSRQG